MSGVRVVSLVLHQRSRSLEVGFDTGGEWGMSYGQSQTSTSTFGNFRVDYSGVGHAATWDYSMASTGGNPAYSYSDPGDLIYEDIDYSNTDLISDDDRNDDRFLVRPAMQYIFRKWLMFELAYQFENRDSTIDVYDFDTNTVVLNANFSL